MGFNSGFKGLSRNILFSTLFMALWDRTPFSLIECFHHCVVLSDMDS